MKFSGMNKILNINKTNNIPPVNLRIKAADKKINVVFLSSRKVNFRKVKLTDQSKRCRGCMDGWMAVQYCNEFEPKWNSWLT